MKAKDTFLIITGLFILGGLTVLGFIQQGDELKFCADGRNSFWNTFFIYGTKLGEEPMYAILTILTFVFLSFKDALKIPLIGFSIMGLSKLLKNIFQHKRPWQYYSDQFISFDEFNLIEGIEPLKGLSSFPSGHTMSGFGLFCLMAILAKDKKYLGWLLGLIAIIVGFSRIYLFHHFLKDVVFGAFLGILVAYIIQYIFEKPNLPREHFLNKNLIQFLKKKTIA